MPPTLWSAEKRIESGEACNSVGAEIFFDWILDQVRGSDLQLITDYILESPGKCPNCQREIFEKTLMNLCD